MKVSCHRESGGSNRLSLYLSDEKIVEKLHELKVYCDIKPINQKKLYEYIDQKKDNNGFKEDKGVFVKKNSSQKRANGGMYFEIGRVTLHVFVWIYAAI